MGDHSGADQVDTTEGFWDFEENSNAENWGAATSTVQSSTDIHLLNLKASRATSTGWKGIDKETGKRLYSTYRGGNLVKASGGEAYRLFMGDKDKDKERGKASAENMPTIDDFFRELPASAVSSNPNAATGKPPQRGLSGSGGGSSEGATASAWSPPSHPAAADLPSLACALESYGRSWRAVGLGGGETTRKMFNANNSLQLPPRAQSSLLLPLSPPQQQQQQQQQERAGLSAGSIRWGFSTA